MSAGQWHSQVSKLEKGGARSLCFYENVLGPLACIHLQLTDNRKYRTWGTGPQRQAKSFDQIKGMEGGI